MISVSSSTRIKVVYLLVISYLKVNESQSLSASDVFSLCATNAPSHVTSLVDIVDVGLPDEIPDAVRCGYRCSVMRQTDRCSAFSVVDGGTSGKTCQFYDNTTGLCFAASSSCVFYQEIRDDAAQSFRRSRVSNSVASASSCSFPFTFNGEIHLQCAVNQSNVTCDIGCFLIGRVWVTCTADSIGFTASSGIVNVSIPTTSDNVQPLQSVNGWLVIMSRMDGTFPLNQTWETYKTGFGNNTLNFWLGLERIYQLTNSAVNGGITYRIRFLLQSLKHRKWFSEDYGLFYVESRLTNYILRTSQTAVGDAGDAINSQFIVGRTLSNGMPFSSWDADNDKGSDNCAGINGGGWWYNYCASARLLGDSHGAYNGFMWWEMQTEAPGEGYALNACFMLVTAVD